MEYEVVNKVAQFLRLQREKKSWSQEELAAKLGTTQSAIARMESGSQNFTTEMLRKIGEVFNRELIKISKSSVDFKINGGNQLSGEIVTNTSKNGAMGLLCSSLLNKGTTILHDVPRIEEVYRMIELFKLLGVEVAWQEPSSLRIQPPENWDKSRLKTLTANRTRSILMSLAPLAHLFEQFSIPHAKGCSLGKRSIAAHKYGMEQCGMQIKVTNDKYKVDSTKLNPAEVILYEASDTGTENMIMLASKIPGKTIIKFASANYQVQEVCFFLEKLGVEIKGIGTTTLEINGAGDIDKDIEYSCTEDPIESMFFITAAIMTNSELTIKRCPIDFLELELLKLQLMGVEFDRSEKYKAKNGETDLVDITVKKHDTLTALNDKISCRPYPGINIDNLNFFVPIATQAEGQTLIHDWVYEDRAIYFMELKKLGADIILADPHRVFINGPTQLKGAQIVSPPALRPSAVVILAMLAAEGSSILRNVYNISRGYEDIANRLNKIGADIEVFNDYTLARDILDVGIS
jgi:UDP-N-acetylglucosamine 1-carboxyvinyltransferase